MSRHKLLLTHGVVCLVKIFRQLAYRVFTWQQIYGGDLTVDLVKLFRHSWFFEYFFYVCGGQPRQIRVVADFRGVALDMVCTECRDTMLGLAYTDIVVHFRCLLGRIVF